MSKLRSVSTKFWSDPFIEDITPNQKLLFLYLITNDLTNMLGIYEVSIKKMSFETGIKKDEVEKGLKVFESLSKVKYMGNYVILVNYLKHQNFNTNMKKSAIDIYNGLPNVLKDSSITVSKSNPLEGFETLLKHYGMVPKVEVETESEFEVEVKDEKEVRALKFASSVKEFNKYDLKMLEAFISYWTESRPTGKKLRFEAQTFFDIGKRLATWSNREKPEKDDGRYIKKDITDFKYE